MTTLDDNYVKILFRFHSDIFDQEMVETMWATVVEVNKAHYKLENIPFYAPFVASQDIVFAEFDEQEQMLTYRETVEYSGNSTIQVFVTDKTQDTNEIRDVFKALGAVSEKANERFFSMEIPKSVDYAPIKAKLDELEEMDTIGYAEPCLAEGHRI